MAPIRMKALAVGMLLVTAAPAAAVTVFQCDFPSDTASPMTTVATEACGNVPDGPTFASVLCRLSAGLALVNVQRDLGALRSKLACALAKGRDLAAASRETCAAGSPRRAKARLRQAERAVVRYAHRLRGATARRTLDDGLRERLLSPADALRADVRALRKNPGCGAPVDWWKPPAPSIDD